MANTLPGQRTPLKILAERFGFFRQRLEQQRVKWDGEWTASPATLADSLHEQLLLSPERARLRACESRWTRSTKIFLRSRSRRFKHLHAVPTGEIETALRIVRRSRRAELRARSGRVLAKLPTPRAGP